MDSGRENLEYIDSLIDRQLLGQLTPEEELWIEQWVRASPVNGEYYREARLLFKTASVSALRVRFEHRVESAYSFFLSQIEVDQKNDSAKFRFLTQRMVGYAASILLVFGLGVTSLYFYRYSTTASVAMQNIEIPYGSKSKVTLPDGTVVWLNSGSKLSYQSDFGKENRNVILDGEGYFNVTKNPKMPFMVKSGKWQVKVLGTKFNFKTYGEDANAKITLIEGSINVSSNTDSHTSVMLKPNQQVSISKTTSEVVVKEVTASTYAMWTEPKKEVDMLSNLNTNNNPNVTIRNTLFFDEEPLEQIFRDLERAFNVKIEIKDAEVKRMKFYGDFRNEETLPDILKIMAATSQLRYNTEGDKIVITK